MENRQTPVTPIETTSPQRQRRFQRNSDLESLLKELNERLALSEHDIGEKFLEPQFPVLLVVGAPRSGTTLLMQWLAQTEQFAYPTNLLSRFFGAPYVGALICQLIGNPKFNYGNELADHSAAARPLQSELGKTRGMFEPNEFWYFWRRFFPLDQAQQLTSDKLTQVDATGFKSGLASLQAVFGKPWAMKGILAQYNLEFLHSILDKVLFLHIQRDVVDNAKSLLKAREEYFGSTDQWFSVRPPGYEKMLSWNPSEQVVGQIHFTNRSIAAESASIPADRFLAVDYQSFCKQPAAVYSQIRQKLQQLGCSISPTYRGSPSFEAQRYSEQDSVSSSLRDAVAKISAMDSIED